MNLISAIIPTYNRPDFLRESLESLFFQTFKDFNVMIVVDGLDKKKEYEDVIDKYSSLDIEVIFLKENSGSVSIPRTIGIANSFSKYIAPVDDDIYNFPNKFELLLKNIEDSKLCYGAMEIKNSPYASFSYIHNWNPLNGWGVDNSQLIYSREVYERIPLSFPKRACDWELAKQIYLEYPGFKCTPDLVSRYTWHGGNRSLDDSTKIKEIYPEKYISYLINRGYKIEI